MKILRHTLLGLGLLFAVSSCEIETSSSKNKISIELTGDDEFIINGEKYSGKKLERELKRLVKELEKEGVSKDEIEISIKEGKENLKVEIDNLKEEIKKIDLPKIKISVE
ncbi:hypothetical protein [Algoriphagus sanaruensis]|uniref:Uncharacterized protein n=1 Tax=Algoriphagus sanaruensis TaxID=1727163 RepID=A0A142EJ80_9BACT|nr:hypothetical protein [Algoriphagus sanaruensis]AMQ55185.1 hypothetical protein AO498_02170 [Algoriphagus sanaruensis]